MVDGVISCNKGIAYFFFFNILLHSQVYYFFLGNQPTLTAIYELHSTVADLFASKFVTLFLTSQPYINFLGVCIFLVYIRTRYS